MVLNLNLEECCTNILLLILLSLSLIMQWGVFFKFLQNLTLVSTH